MSGMKEDARDRQRLLSRSPGMHRRQRRRVIHPRDTIAPIAVDGMDEVAVRQEVDNLHAPTRETTEERVPAAMDMALHLARPCASPSLCRAPRGIGDLLLPVTIPSVNSQGMEDDSLTEVPNFRVEAVMRETTPSPPRSCGVGPNSTTGQPRACYECNSVIHMGEDLTCTREVLRIVCAAMGEPTTKLSECVPFARPTEFDSESPRITGSSAWSLHTEGTKMHRREDSSTDADKSVRGEKQGRISKQC